MSLSIALTLSLASSCPQQDPPPPYEHRGMASAWPAGVYLKTGPGVISSFRQKPTLDQTASLPDAPQQLAGQNNTPEYAEVLKNVRQQGLVIDAVSSGNGVFVPTIDGAPDFQASENWAAISVSITDESPCVAQSPFRRAREFYASRSGNTAGAGGELVSYYFHGSAGIGALAGTSMLEMSRIHFGIPISSTDEISSMDYGFGVAFENLNMPSNVLMPTKDRVYFSVTADSAEEYNTSTPAGTYFPSAPTGPTPWRGADIYVMRRASNGSWIGPLVYATAESLGIDGDGDFSDVDALDVDSRKNIVIYSPERGTTMESTLPTAEYSQLMVVQLERLDWGTTSGDAFTRPSTSAAPHDSTPKALRTMVGGTAVKVATQMNLDDDEPVDTVEPTGDEVDVICVFDPEAPGADQFLGTARAHWPRELAPLGLSVVRLEPIDGTEPGMTRWKAHVTGWGEWADHTGVVSLYRRDGNIGYDNYLNPVTWSNPPITRAIKWDAGHEAVSLEFELEEFPQDKHALFAIFYVGALQDFRTTWGIDIDQ